MSTQIKPTDTMVSRFLAWPLPANFAPDNGLTLVMSPGSTWPTGTNLFNAQQVREMLEHVLAEPAEKPAVITTDMVLLEIGYNGFVRSLFNRSGDPSKDFAHAVLGIATENHELVNAFDTINAVEEAGDITFYYYAAMQVIKDHFGPPLSHEFTAEETATFERLAGVSPRLIRNEINELLDVAKRWVGYAREPKLTSGQLSGRLCALLSAILMQGPKEVQDQTLVIRTNIDKLLDRYKGIVFSADRAINRDVAAERKVLEDATTA